MNDYFNAFEMGPVSERGLRAVAPGIHRGIYAMPSFITLRTRDLAASVEFWTHGLGFVELFGIPDRLVHLRRWAYQDVLLVPDSDAEHDLRSAVSISFSYVEAELAGVAEACERLRPGSVTGPTDTAWTTRDLEVRTPEGVLVVCTAPREVGAAEAAEFDAMGIAVPDAGGEGDNGLDD